jgi:hypothetical protein
MSILTGEDAILQGPKCTAAMTAVTRLPGFVRVHCESVEILPDFDYVTSSDYLSHLGTYSSKAEGRIQDVRVTAHQDKRHLNEHTDIQQTQGSSLHKDHPKLFRLRKVEVPFPRSAWERNLFPGTQSVSGIALQHGALERQINSKIRRPTMKPYNLLLAAVWILVWPAQEIKAQWVQTNGPYGGTVNALVASGTNLFAGTYDGGVFLSTNNGTSWSQTGLTNTNVHALAVSGTNLFAGTGWAGVFLSTDNGTSWTAVNTGLTNTNVYALAVSGTNLFAGTLYNGRVFLSTNNGTSWTAASTGLPTNISVYALAVSGTNLFAGTYGGGVFLSTDNGTSWTAVNTGLTNTNVYALAVSGTNLFAGTSPGGVFLSTDNGTSWTAVNTGLTNTSVRALAVSGTNLFAGTYLGGVFLSTNNGTSWIAVNTGLTTNVVYSFAVSGTNLFAGGGGVFLSTNNGTSWTAVSTGLTNSVDAFAVSGTNLFAGTSGSGVWRRPLSEMMTSVKEVHSSLTESYALEQNYPNPFNPSTTIRFSLPKSGYVTLKVYDLLGRQVETLVDGERTAGTYSVEWTPKNLASGVSSKGGYASGVYFYRIQAGAFSDVKRLVLLK